MKSRLIHSISEVPIEQWRPLETPDFPFTDYEFLHCLEASRSVGPGTGWMPNFLTLWNEDHLEAAMPLYEKHHSYGEYIFDWEWAGAHERYGIPYYPKELVGIPFTPATGPKLLAKSELAKKELIQAWAALRGSNRHSSQHALFLTEPESRLFEQAEFSIRETFQFHWKNEGYECFNDFLSRFRAKARNQIRGERKKTLDAGFEIEILEGDAIEPHWATWMNRFYLNTSEKKWGSPYLTAEFWDLIFKEFRHRMVLCRATQDNHPVAASISFKKGHHLYGRYWGCEDEQTKFLHFEVCYYRLIEYAIENQLTLFEAGAQGEHKLKRGFLPEIIRSAHWIRQPEFGDAIQHFLKEESTSLRRGIDESRRHWPFRS